MEEFGLGSALKKWPVLADAIFPEDSKRSIRAEEFNSKVAFEEREANAKTADYFLNYIQLMESRKEDGKLRSLLYIYITEITKTINYSNNYYCNNNNNGFKQTLKLTRSIINEDTAV